MGTSIRSGARAEAGFGSGQFGRLVSDSWRRCESEYGLSDVAGPSVDVLESASLVQIQDQCAALIDASENECLELHLQTRRMRAIVVLTDRDGVVVRTHCDADTEDLFHDSYLMPGAIWSEELQGTNGMGTSLAANRLVNINRGDHFFPRYRQLTCISAPLHDHVGRIIGALDVSTMHQDFNAEEQRFTCGLVQLSSSCIENNYFRDRFRDHPLLAFHPRAELLGTGGEGLIALDADGRIAGLNGKALSFLCLTSRKEIVGGTLPDLFDMDEAGPLIVRPSHASGECIQVLHHHASNRRYLARLHLAPAQSGRFPVSVFPAMPSEGRKENAREPAPVVVSLDDVAGEDPGVGRTCRHARKAFTRGIHILVTGETGTGKQAFARALHDTAGGGLFAAICCHGLAEDSFRQRLAELQQPVAGSAERKPLPATLFLDRISELEPALQALLLRFLDRGESQGSAVADVRVIGSDTRDVRECVEEGDFREDLYFLVNGLSVHLPTVRQRADREHLLARLLEIEAQDSGPSEFSDSALTLLSAYAWPGNLREMRNIVRTAVAICDGHRIQRKHLPDLQTHRFDRTGMVRAESGGGVPLPEGVSLTVLQNAERDAIMRQLEQHRWKVSRVAAELNTSRSTLYRKIKRYGISLDTLS